MKEFCELLLNCTKNANLCVIPQTCGTYDRLAVYKQPERRSVHLEAKVCSKTPVQTRFRMLFGTTHPRNLSFMKKPGEATLKQPTSGKNLR